MVIEKKLIKKRFRAKHAKNAKNETNRYQAVDFHLIDLGFDLDKYLEFLCGLRLEAPTFGATLRE